MVSWENGHVWSISSMYKVGDNDLSQLKLLRELRNLDLQDSHITNDALVHLSGMDSLERIHLGHTKVTSEGLRHFAGLTKLAALDLTGTLVVLDNAVEHLKQFPNLRWLDLRMTPRTKTSAAALAELMRELPDLQFHPAGVVGLYDGQAT
jgi:Leucine rich repeat